MKMKIALDLDGTIANTPQSLLNGLKETGKVPSLVTLEDCHWHYFEWDPVKQTGFRDVTFEDTKDMFMQPSFWADIPLFDGVKSILEILADKCEIHVVTARYWYDGIQRDTEEWLERNDVPYDFIACVPSKKKGDYALAHGLNAAIEDYAAAANSLASSVERVFLIDRPWNKTDNLASNCFRLTWPELGKLFLERVPTMEVGSSCY
jgi:uncharacterized HAD superfamily protein